MPAVNLDRSERTYSAPQLHRTIECSFTHHAAINKISIFSNDRLILETDVFYNTDPLVFNLEAGSGEYHFEIEVAGQNELTSAEVTIPPGCTQFSFYINEQGELEILTFNTETDSP
jgi:hypothetical protein